MSLQSALIGFLVSKMLPRRLTPQEIIVVQTTAVATGTMPLAAGFVGILPALGLLDPVKDGQPAVHLTWPQTIAWSLAVAFFGYVPITCLVFMLTPLLSPFSVFLSPPIRKHVVCLAHSSYLMDSYFLHRLLRNNLLFHQGLQQLILYLLYTTCPHQPKRDYVTAPDISMLKLTTTMPYSTKTRPRADL